MRVFTIGFTKKSAEQFFGRLREAKVRRVIDVRLNNVSQLAGFAKRRDLEFFLSELASINYVHIPLLAPTKEMLDDLKKRKGPWAVYERRFLELMQTRRIEDEVSDELLDDGCLLCSEHLPHHCHRRLVVEYLRDHGKKIDVEHLV